MALDPQCSVSLRNQDRRGPHLDGSMARLKPCVRGERSIPTHGSPTSALTISERQAGSPGILSTRIKEMREECYTRNCEEAITAESKQQQQQRMLRYHGRWNALRRFYAIVCERLPKGKQKIWLRRLVEKIHSAIVGSVATLPQMEIACTDALQSLVLSRSAWNDILRSLREAFEPFQRDDPSRIDLREFVCACIVLDRWQDGEVRILALWMDEYSLPVRPVGDMAISVVDVRRIFMTPCAGTADEQSMEPFVVQVESMAASHVWIQTTVLKTFAATSSSLRDLLKALCWRRLIEDMRLEYFRNAYVEAMACVEREETSCRLAAAMHLWKLREPRVRFARWKDFVVVKKSMRRGDEHYLKWSRHKAILRLKQNQDRVEQLKRMMALARVTQCNSLLHWTLNGWRQFCVSMREIHRASLHRSVRYHQHVLVWRSWQALVEFMEAGRSEKARRQVMLDRFIAHRHRKVLRESWKEWIFVYRRQREIGSAILLEQQLHQEIRAQRQEETEHANMALEDALSHFVQERDRQLEEQAHQRSFQEATERVRISRKLKQQEDERTRLKKAREERLVSETDVAWARIGDRVATDVRKSTIDWFASSDGEKAVHAEASEIFERDPVMIQKALIDNPQAFAIPGCRWQLRLEDYGGRFAKPFYINLETLEKFVCDELVMENCESIAKEVLIQRKIEEARERLRAKASNAHRERQQHEAAVKIQMLFRCRHALLVMRARIRTTFVKRVEPTTGDAVYFNISKQESRRRPPRLIGSDEPLIPVESSTWVRRIDDDGNNYYLHLVSGETSWAPPAHHLMCIKCKHNFATRRWNETGRRYCVVCFAEGLKKASFTPVATWTKLSVQPAKCLVCRNSLAEVECHECRGDTTCWNCCQAVHRNPRLAAHREMESLVHR